MNKKQILCKRYAQAFLRVFGSHFEERDLDRIDALRNCLRSSEIMHLAMHAHSIKEQQIRDLFTKAFEYVGLRKEWSTLVDVLLRGGRISLMSGVLKYIRNMYKQSLGKVSCTIFTSHTMNQDHLDALVLFIEKNIGKNIIYDVRIDSSLIAGVAVRGANFYWEHSVRRHVQQIKEPLVRRGYYECEKY